MTEKDPEDMTAAELLRWTANGDPDEHGNTFVGFKLLAALSGKRYSSTTNDDDARNIRDFANQIDEEIEAARRDAAKEPRKPMFAIRRIIASGTDWPEPREGEGLRDWLERCWLPLPRYRDGEPVQFGDNDIDWDDTGECRAPGARWNATAVDCSGRLLATSFSKIVAVAKTDENGRAKRRTPEVLGADGLPIVECETAYPISGDWIGYPLEVASIDRDGSVRVSLPEGKGWTCYLADRLTHTPPDTQERIDEAARKSSYAYWGCMSIACDDCPSTIDGKKPHEYFDCINCLHAKTLDLLRRQRELDVRKGGE